MMSPPRLLTPEEMATLCKGAQEATKNIRMLTAKLRVMKELREGKRVPLFRSTDPTPTPSGRSVVQKGTPMSAWTEIEQIAKAKVVAKECPSFGAAVREVGEERGDLYARYREEMNHEITGRVVTQAALEEEPASLTRLHAIAKDLVRQGHATESEAFAKAVDTAEGRVLRDAYYTHRVETLGHR